MGRGTGRESVCADPWQAVALAVTGGKKVDTVFKTVSKTFQKKVKHIKSSFCRSEKSQSISYGSSKHVTLIVLDFIFLVFLRRLLFLSHHYNLLLP